MSVRRGGRGWGGARGSVVGFALVGACAAAPLGARLSPPARPVDAAAPSAETSALAPSALVVPPAASSAAAPAAPRCDPSVVKSGEEDEPGRVFAVAGYLRRGLSVAVEGGAHCIEIMYPDGDSSWARRPCRTSEQIDEGWLRLVANTLARLPRAHATLVRRLVIDNRPTEHGIAPFNRKDAGDNRDGHTLWLHERLFEEPNHWAEGNHGRYWSYHTNVDGRVAQGSGPRHTLFSPVLLHETAHLVSYSLAGEQQDREIIPACAVVCGGGTCKALSPGEKERGCLSPYCMPFKNDVGTENFAEQYRLFFQSGATRTLLSRTEGSCFSLLDELTQRLGHGAPWLGGLPDIPTYRRSIWKSCGERACKPY